MGWEYLRERACNQMLSDYLQLPVPVRILCLGSFFNRAGSFVVIFLAIYASEQLGFGVPFATACIGVLGLGSMIGSFIGGQLADQIGRRTVMLIALFGGAILLALLSTVTNKWGFMACVGLFSLVADLYRPAAAAMLSDLVPIERRPHAFALMYISIILGFAIAPPLGGILASYSFQYLFWLDAITMAIFGVIILVAIRESQSQDAERGDVSSATTDNDRGGWRAAVSHMAADVPFVLFCVSTLLIALVFVQGFSTLPIHLRQLGYSNFQFGLLMSINGLLIFLVQLPLTHWLSRFNAMNMVVAGGLLISLGFGLTAIPGGTAFVALCIAVWTLGEILQAPFTQSIVSGLAPEHLKGNYQGLFTMCYATAVTFGAPLGGEVLHRLGPTALWTGVFLLALVAVAIYAAIHPLISKRLTTELS